MKDCEAKLLGGAVQELMVLYEGTVLTAVAITCETTTIPTIDILPQNLDYFTRPQFCS